MSRLSTILIITPPSLGGGGGGGDPPTLQWNFSGITSQAGMEALPGWMNTDYTYWGASDGLSVCTTDGDPVSGNSVSIQSNMPVGAQGFSSGGGFGFQYANGDAPVSGGRFELWFKLSSGFSTEGTGGGNPDFKLAFNATGDSYAGSGNKALIATGRTTIAKVGEFGDAFMDRMYSYPDTRFDTRFMQLIASVASFGWCRLRCYDVNGAGTVGVNVTEWYAPGQLAVQVSTLSYVPTALNMGHLTLGNNLNLFINSAQTVRWSGMKYWALGLDPGFGF